jgi:hypothetical protein
MQTQQRPSQSTQPVAQKPAMTVKHAPVQGAPLPLDAGALRQVSGAGTDGPHKTW